jgi:1L-myo-inositol 1-phosphate cytidylyltransferase / CDP-L-myo-inositol myo-inositolphosphotransferase
MSEASEPFSEQDPAAHEGRRAVARTIEPPRVGVVLAAGRSERLHRVTGGGSKALVRLGGLTFVERAVRMLLSKGIEKVLVVVGYHAGPVAAVVGRLAPGRVQAVHAEGWEAGNGASLAAAEQAVKGEDLFVLLTADHVFGEAALDGLLRANRPSVLVDEYPETAVWEEGTRVRVENGRALAFGKHLDEPAVDCGAFVFPQEIFAAQRRAAERDDASLAGAVSILSEETAVETVALPARSWWIDVDTPEDFATARRLTRRSLSKEGDGPVSRYLNRPISTRISIALAPLRLPPDLLSVVFLVVGVAAGWLLAMGNGIAGGVMTQVASVLDGVDGETARLQLRAGPHGAMLDGVLDRLVDTAILAGMGVWALSDGSSARSVVLLTAVAITGALLSMASKDRAASLALPPAPERPIGYTLGGRDGRLLIVAVAAVLGAPFVGLAVVAVTAAIALAIRLVFVLRSGL